ncbi:MAG: hypothetical protein QOI66_2032 [Myxococcales bacterium]|jgi:hypothetical protein|nr:hypothetical protein [Myxococcales bacterium]
MNLKKTILSAFGGMALATVLFAAPAFAADKTYQVTGPVLEVTDATVTVQKGKEKWQIARDKDTKVTGELKVGAKVTIQYRMTAETIEAKADGKAADAKAPPAKK